jgi:HTH-type transcriptional regulator / antitoxin HipB
MARPNQEQRLVSEHQTAEILRQRRKARGISQRELASKLGVQQARLSLFENGQAHLTLERLIAIARVLDLDVVLRERPSKPSAAEW